MHRKADASHIPTLTMFFDTTRGKRISRIPKPLQPLALVVRNALRLPGEIGKANRRRARLGNAHERSVADALSLAVEYVYAADVAGDLAEFGTMTGATAMILARAMSGFPVSGSGGVKNCSAANGEPRKLHLFDSFRGLPEPAAAPDRESFHVRAGVWKAGSCQGIDARELRRRCRRHLPDDRIEIHAGWFSETVKAFTPSHGLALVHLDCDLYQSTLDVLEPCLARAILQEGAMVLFDDWNCNRASPAFGVRKAWSEVVARFQIDASDEGSYGWGARKFIVHRYQAASAT